MPVPSEMKKTVWFAIGCDHREFAVEAGGMPGS
jgi:hypothetical protein